MSIEAYLATLNEEQLQFALAEARRLLAKKADKKKHLVWTVEDGSGGREAFFSDADYLRAAQYLLGKAKEISQSCPPKSAAAIRRMELRIGHELIPESEYPEFYRVMVEKPEPLADKKD